MSDRNRILCEFRNKTKSIMGDSLKQMILYGSYARGDYGDNSDMDIMVLTELTDIMKSLSFILRMETKNVLLIQVKRVMNIREHLLLIEQ